MAGYLHYFFGIEERKLKLKEEFHEYEGDIHFRFYLNIKYKNIKLLLGKGHGDEIILYEMNIFKLLKKNDIFILITHCTRYNLYITFDITINFK